MKTNHEMARLLRPYVGPVSRTAAVLERHGWAEAHAGNFSIRLDTDHRGMRLLVKRAGARMRDLARAPLDGLVLIDLNARDEVTAQYPPQVPPTSELPTHVAVQRVLSRSRREDRVLLHAHPTSLISLSLLVPGRELVALLGRMHVEAPLLLSGRIAAIEFHVPGTDRLARTTAAAMRQAQAVIWPMHGIVASGPTLDDALDLIELADKAAAIALQMDKKRMRGAGLTFAQEMAVRGSGDRA